MAVTRTKRLTLNLTPAEWAVLAAAADADGIDTNRRARLALLAGLRGAGTPPQIDGEGLAEALYPAVEALMTAQAEALTEAFQTAMRLELKAFAANLQDKFLPRVVAAAGGRIDPRKG